MFKQIAALACVVVVGACNTSPVPVGTVAEAPFDSALIGVWAANIESPAPDTMIIMEFSAPEYYVELIPSNKADNRARARAYISRVGDLLVMNARELSFKPAGYTFYEFSVRNDTLTVYALSDASTKFESSAELRAWLHANRKSSDFHDGKPVSFWRVRAN